MLYEELVRPAAAWASPAHPKRATPYEEARCVHVLGLAGDGVLAQMRAYRAAGLPDDAPLIEGEWHLRDLADNRSAAPTTAARRSTRTSSARRPTGRPGPRATPATSTSTTRRLSLIHI